MADIYKIMPVSLKNDVLTVAMADPQNLAALDDLRNFLGYDVRGAVSNLHDVEQAIERHYADKQDSIEDIIGSLNEPDAEAETEGLPFDLASDEEISAAAPVRKLLNMVLLLAIKDQASDIHFEPFEDEFKIRVRADGVLYEMVPPPRHLANAITTRIKVMAELDIAERRLPQDGRIELNVGGNPVDLRVSVLPTMFGESVVLRILDRTVVQLDLNKIGMDTTTLRRFRNMIESPNGIVLVTGPTGSGKTTTLYSALNELNSIETKIITTEDPIEYDIDGLVQVPVNPDIDVTFANVLRAILRHDPDIILIGEIRDYETAEIPEFTYRASCSARFIQTTPPASPGCATNSSADHGHARRRYCTAVGAKICTECRTSFSPA
jgi:type IV pilus assembly protein PilB